jgi:hypothetical protein
MTGERYYSDKAIWQIKADGSKKLFFAMTHQLGIPQTSKAMIGSPRAMAS